MKKSFYCVEDKKIFKQAMNRVRTFPEWEQFYRETPEDRIPWMMFEFDPYVDRALTQLNLNARNVLEVGTGSGLQALELAKRGFQVTATDISHAAVSLARNKAKEKGVEIDFKQDDILNSKLNGEFDLILDRGCFHCFHTQQIPEYIRTVRRLLTSPGYLLLQCRSDLESTNLLKSYTAPYRYAPKDIEEIFSDRFNIVSIERAQYTDYIPGKPTQLFCILEKSSA
ncbi:MAG: class I SAM-dependent methyltransferase [Cyanobacteriota bacterium]|nr:class I SAM-dependent methyltransferase [Cyanobacteriota bacterium]